MIRLGTSEIPGDSDVPDIVIEDGITTRYVAGVMFRAGQDAGMAGISILASVLVPSQPFRKHRSR